MLKEAGTFAGFNKFSEINALSTHECSPRFVLSAGKTQFYCLFLDIIRCRLTNPFLKKLLSSVSRPK